MNTRARPLIVLLSKAYKNRGKMLLVVSLRAEIVYKRVNAIRYHTGRFCASYRGAVDEGRVAVYLGLLATDFFSNFSTHCI